MNDLPEPALVVILFHGLQIFNGGKAWRKTWLQRGTDVCWPAKWLPEDLGEKSVRVLSLSYDANAFGNTGDVRHIGHNLTQSLVSSPSWGFGKKTTIVLIGHSFGGLVIKSLVIEAAKIAYQPFPENKSISEQASITQCKTFLENLQGVVFYSVPHSGSELATYARMSKKFVVVGKPLAGILSNLVPFQRDMATLSVEFTTCVPSTINIYAFGEGKLTKGFMVVEDASAMQLARGNYYKVEDADHLDVCKPASKRHPSYAQLLDRLKVILEARGYNIPKRHTQTASSSIAYNELC